MLIPLPFDPPVSITIARNSTTNLQIHTQRNNTSKICTHFCSESQEPLHWRSLEHKYWRLSQFFCSIWVFFFILFVIIRAFRGLFIFISGAVSPSCLVSQLLGFIDRVRFICELQLRPMRLFIGFRSFQEAMISYWFSFLKSSLVSFVVMIVIFWMIPNSA